MLLGSLSSGIIAKHYGQRKAILNCITIQCILGVTSPFVTNTMLFIFLRSAFGFIVGASVPLVLTTIAEITPRSVRGKGNVLLNFFYTFGRIEVCFLAYATLTSFKHGHWRMLLLLTSIPNILCLFLNYLYLDDSPHFLYLKEGNHEKAIENLNKMGAENDKNYVKLTTIEIVESKIWGEKVNEQVKKFGDNPYLALF
jgi:MFS family permease